MSEGMYNGYVPGAHGPVRLPASFHWKEKKVSENPPQFEKRAYIQVFLPGGDIVDRPIKDEDKYEYPKQWDAFQKGGDQSAVGWPLEHCPFLDVAQVATYKALGIPTVEALATAPDTAIQNVLGALDHRKQAIAVLKSAASTAPMLEIMEQNKALETKLDLQTKQIAELCAEMEKLKKGKGNKADA